jgi:hypothetical protein
MDFVMEFQRGFIFNNNKNKNRHLIFWMNFDVLY